MKKQEIKEYCPSDISLTTSQIKEIAAKYESFGWRSMWEWYKGRRNPSENRRVVMQEALNDYLEDNFEALMAKKNTAKKMVQENNRFQKIAKKLASNN